MFKSDSTLENNTHKIFLDINTEMDYKILIIRQNLVVISKKKKKKIKITI